MDTRDRLLLKDSIDRRNAERIASFMAEAAETEHKRARLAWIEGYTYDKAGHEGERDRIIARYRHELDLDKQMPPVRRHRRPQKEVRGANDREIPHGYYTTKQRRTQEGMKTTMYNDDKITLSLDRDHVAAIIDILASQYLNAELLLKYSQEQLCELKHELAHGKRPENQEGKVVE